MTCPYNTRSRYQFESIDRLPVRLQSGGVGFLPEISTRERTFLDDRIGKVI